MRKEVFDKGIFRRAQNTFTFCPNKRKLGVSYRRIPPVLFCFSTGTPPPHSVPVSAGTTMAMATSSRVYERVGTVELGGSENEGSSLGESLPTQEAGGDEDNLAEDCRICADAGTRDDPLIWPCHCQVTHTNTHKTPHRPTAPRPHPRCRGPNNDPIYHRPVCMQHAFKSGSTRGLTRNLLPAKVWKPLELRNAFSAPIPLHTRLHTTLPANSKPQLPSPFSVQG